MMLKNLNPYAAIIFSTILWGTWWYPLRLLNRYAENNAIPLTLCYAFAGIILLIASFKNLNILSKKNIYLTLLAGLFGGTAMGFYNEGMFRGNVGRVLIFFYLSVVWSTIIEIYFLNKRLTIYRGLSIGLGFCGLFVITGIDQGSLLPRSLADLFGILSGVAWSLCATFLRINKELDINFATSMCILFGGLFVLIATIFPSGQTITGFNFEILSQTYILILIFSFLWLLPAYWLICMGQDQIDPGIASILMLFEVVIGIISAYFLANEIITVRELIGGIFVLSAPLIELRSPKK